MLKKILGDSSIYFIGSFAGQLAGFCALYLIMSTLAVEEFGYYSYAVAFAAIFLFLGDGGLSQYIIKKISQNPEEEVKIYQAAQGAQIVISVLLILLMTALAGLAHGEEDFRNIVILGSGGAIAGLFNPVFSFLIAKGERKFILYKELVVGISRLIFTLIGALANASVFYFSFMNYATAIAMLVFIFIVRYGSRWHHFLSVEVNWRQIYSMLRTGLPYTLLMGANILYNKIDILMLKSISSGEQVGFYAGAAQLVYPFMFISAAMTTAVFPLLSRNSEQSFIFRRVLVVSASLTGGVGFALSTVLFFSAGIIFEILFEGKYDGSLPSYRILVWYLAIVFVYGVLNSSIMAKGGIAFLVILNLLMLTVNVFLNFILIPIYGAEGAAMATIICEIVVLLCVGSYCLFSWSRGWLST